MKNIFKKTIKILTLILIINSFFYQNIFAAGSTILPKLQDPLDVNQSVEEFCKSKNQADGYYTLLDDSNPKYDPIEAEAIFNEKGKTAEGEKWQESLLACAISLGLIHLWMFPYYIIYWIEFLIQISGILAVLMFVIGGILYIMGGGLIEEISKDKGKTTMTWAAIGMVVTLLAWVIVNVLLNFVSQ